MKQLKCQQDELYVAERTVPRGRAFASVTEIQQFVDDLRDTWWWPRWYPQVARVEVYGRSSRCDESVGWFDAPKRAGAIEMLHVHWNEREVLHELAHVLAHARYGSRAHDPWFARTYIELVALVMDTDVYRDLYRSFEDAGIEHDPPDERRLGEARRMPEAS